MIEPTSSTFLPLFISSPCLLVLEPIFNEEEKAISRSLKFVSSFNTTVSTPVGKGAPVKILIAYPGLIFELNGIPAAENPC